MATPPKSFFPWRRFQRAVGVWAAGALGFDPAGREVVWADFNVQRPPLPYLGLQVTAGPTRRAQDAELWPRQLPTVVNVTITPAAVANVGDLTNLFVNGELFTHTAILADTVTTVRNDLVTQINASVQLYAVAAPIGANVLQIVAAEPLPGEVYALSVEAALGCTQTTVTSRLIAQTIGARDIRVRATAYGAPEPNDLGQVSVAEWIELLAEATQDPDLRLPLRRQGFVISNVNVLQQRATAPSGGEREPRTAADLMFACEVRRGRVTTTWLDEVIEVQPEPV